MGSVNITLANGQLGTSPKTDDGVAGMVLTGVSEGTYTVGTPILLTRATDLTILGIGAANAFAKRQVEDFYREAGNGAKLYLMLVPATMRISEIAFIDNAASARKLLDYSGGKIKLLGIMTNDTALTTAGTTITVDDGLNEDVYDAVGNMAVMANAYFAAQKPFRAIIGGTSYNGVAAELRDQVIGSVNNRTAVLIGDTVSGNQACLGLALGRLAAVPVMRKISRVRTGPLNTNAAYVGTHTAESAAGELAVIADAGFITWCTYPNVSGYYFSHDGTCSALTDDYHALARGRVIDKAHVLAYSTFVQEVDDEVPVNEDGTLDAGFCKWLSGQITNRINNTMTANREISSVACLIDPEQNILSTNELKVVLSLTPVGYATDISISLGFSNPAV